MLNLREFSHTHHPSSMKRMARFIRRGLRVFVYFGI